MSQPPFPTLMPVKHPTPLRPPEIEQLSWRCPAKLNLRLAIVGRRDDGYHELISVVAPISLYDRIELRWRPEASAPKLEIVGGGLEPAPDNLVLRAVEAFSRLHAIPGSLTLKLEKTIPVGAGLGGGSSDAAGTLLALQTMWGHPLEPGDLESLALGLGADVPFFLSPEVSVMRGIGEALTPARHLAKALEGREFLVFKPSFGISTAWAYEALAERGDYQVASDEEALLVGLENGTRRMQELPFNGFRAVVDARYPTVPLVLAAINAVPGVRAEMSGSGSACFAFFRDPEQAAGLISTIRRAWGEAAFVRSVRIA